MRKIKIFVAFLTVIVSTLALFSNEAFAQGLSFADMSVAVSQVSADPDIAVGDIVRMNETGQVVRSETEFDERMVGVYNREATIIYHTGNEGIPIAFQGQVLVNVTTAGGPIMLGDLITTSSIAGRGQRSLTTRGQVLGIALGALGESDGVEANYEGRIVREGKIPVSIDIRPGDVQSVGIVSKMVDQFGSLVLKNIDTPERSESFFRFIMAGLIAAVAVIVSFVTFGRNITRGLEAIGRNPLARAQIQAMIVVNVLLIAAISIGAIMLSLAIIRY